MPQLDFLIIGSESIFIIFFLVGYFFFLKNILSILAFELKFKTKLEISYLVWFFKNQTKMFEIDSNLLDLLVKLQTFLKFIENILSPSGFLFGIYKSDLLLLKLKKY